MYFDSYKSILYSDTPLPDIFITEYMPSMECEYVKVYIYCLFLSKHNRISPVEDLSKKLEIDAPKVREALAYLENVGAIVRTDDGITMTDLKEKEINKIYRMKQTSTPEEALFSSERNKARNRIISAINEKFFQGVMSPSWYTDLDTWFDRYGFEEDVMFALFQHCYDHSGLAKQYIAKVADNWCSKGIKNSFDLDRYFMEYEKLKDIRLKIMKKLKRQGLLTEYEEEFMQKWVFEYNYGFDIIEMALRRTTGTSNPNFNYINSIITDWHKNGLKSKDDISAYIKSKKQTGAGKGTTETGAPQRVNFEQRKYDDEYYDGLYKNVRE